MKILTINGGSSSLKARVDEISGEPPFDPPSPQWQEDFEGSSLEPVLKACGAVDVVGHRIVHGGGWFPGPVRITPEVRIKIAEFAQLAPAHAGFELEAIDLVERTLGVPQVAVFDTSFHLTLPAEAYVYPGPRAWLDRGIRRYGFHGISHQYVSRKAARLLGGRAARMITCHLGNGCSLAAVRDGVCVDTTMGFTPLDGLMMGTRAGSVDPGILIYLLRNDGCSPTDLERLLGERSGLAGLSGISGDMRRIEEARAAGDARATLAFDVFVHRVAAGIGSMLASLGGLEALVFTGGIGEHSAAVREAVSARWQSLGAQVLVVETAENWEIARESHLILST